MVTTAVQQAHTIKSKRTVAHGIVYRTCAEAALTRLSEKMAFARWTYSDSRAQLLKLNSTAQDIATFKLLQDSDMQGLSRQLLDRRELGQGYVSLPWYWRVSISESTESVTPEEAADKINKEYYESSYPQYYLHYSSDIISSSSS